MECQHEHLTRIGPDLYQCDQCGVVILVVQGLIVTAEFAAAITGVFLEQVAPEVAQKLRADLVQEAEDDGQS